MEKIFIPSETKKSAGVRDTICKKYTSKEGTGARQTGPMMADFSEIFLAYLLYQ